MSCIVCRALARCQSQRPANSDVGDPGHPLLRRSGARLRLRLRLRRRREIHLVTIAGDSCSVDRQTDGRTDGWRRDRVEERKRRYDFAALGGRVVFTFHNTNRPVVHYRCARARSHVSVKRASRLNSWITDGSHGSINHSTNQSINQSIKREIS